MFYLGSSATEGVLIGVGLPIPFAVTSLALAAKLVTGNDDEHKPAANSWQ